MRHHRRTARLGRNFSERRALLENLVGSLLSYQEIKTTLPKAKAAKRLADHVITLGKNDTLASRRQVFSYLQDHQLTSKLFKEVAPRFKERKGGYTRILQLQRRKGDGAQLALLELTEKEIVVKEQKKPKKKESKAAAGHAGHEHEKKLAKDHAAREERSKAEGDAPKEAHFPKHPEKKQEKPKMGFFKNLGRFFRNKGGG